MTGTALVTGAAGFVGRHFTAHLREQGWKVYALDTREYPGLTSVTDARTFFAFDLDLRFDLVLHCAAVVGGRQVIDHQPLDQAVNLELDAALFRWARQARPGRVVYFSSSAVYPAYLQEGQRRNRLREDLVDAQLPGQVVGVPDQLYGLAKLIGENLACRARDEGLAVTVVRPFSGYGEDQDDCYPFPAFVDRALAREDPFLIWGTGGQVRDFIHIDDIVEATMLLAERGINGPFNLGSGVGVSMRHLAQKICHQAGYEPEFEAVPTAPSGVAWRVASVEKLFAVRAPRITLDRGIARVLKARQEVARARTGAV